MARPPALAPAVAPPPQQQQQHAGPQPLGVPPPLGAPAQAGSPPQQRMPKGTLLGMPADLAAQQQAGQAAGPGGIPKGTLLGMPAEPTAGGGPVQAPRSDAPGAYGDGDDGATMVSRVPDELLVAAASGDMAGMGEALAEERHFREVFDQFVALKRQCNESIVGLTHDKFVQTLKKNKEQIVTKHGAKSVRFTVYVKDGKAALKATPVKE